MERIGTILWLETENTNIYTISPNADTPATLYNTKAQVIFLDDEKRIELRCSFRLYDYRVYFEHKKANVLEGKMFSEGKECGYAVLHLYGFQKKYFCRMQWYEADNYNWDAFILIE